jgi:hypothetical protein
VRVHGICRGGVWQGWWVFMAWRGAFMAGPVDPTPSLSTLHPNPRLHTASLSPHHQHALTPSRPHPTLARHTPDYAQLPATPTCF